MNERPIPDLKATEAYFHREIPITAAMGIRVESYDASRLVLAAPLDFNHNHLGTAFGGSIAAVATLAGYGFLWLELADSKIHLVVRDSHITYRRPVRREIRAICHRPPAEEMEHFRALLQRQQRSRVRLRVTVEEDGEVAAELEGTFVALAD